MNTASNRLLRNILRSLIDEYGSEEVFSNMEKIVSKEEERELYFETRRRQNRGQRPTEVAKARRPSAIDQAKRFLPHAEEPDVLLSLADRFDRKEFLPHLSDIREFLVRMGAASDAVRDRMEGFRHVLVVLAQLPSDRLRKLSDLNTPSGPAQLAPLAEAIRSAGDTMRESNDRSFSSGQRDEREDRKPSGKSPSSGDGETITSVKSSAGKSGPPENKEERRKED